jgi:L-lactate dehydrogenase (cytochrome)
VLTVDVAVLASRENNVRAGCAARLGWTFNTFLKTLVRHGMPHFENSFAERGAPILSGSVMRDFTARDHLGWEHFDLIRKRWAGKLVVKGVLAKEDALAARDRGADGIVVSNHGGRQLDGAVSPLRVLPEIAEAIAGTIPVMMDSGVRRGTDVLKALALGADFVFVGRPFLFAASVAGEAGVLQAANMLSTEVSTDMALLGINTLGELGPHLLRRMP